MFKVSFELVNIAECTVIYDLCSPGKTCHWFSIRCRWDVGTCTPILPTAISCNKSWFHFSCLHDASMRMGLGIVYNLEFSFPFLLSQLFSLLFMAFHLSMFQASSARAIRLLKGTTGCWTRFRLYGGSARTSASSEEIPTALPYLDLGSELPASVCSPSPITLKVGHH